MAALSTDEWKQRFIDYLLEQNAKINAAKNVQDNGVVLERLRKDNLRFIQKVVPGFLPTIED